ncbi:hypothetical protein EYF80_011675 [Liparis tanakae]|uniref:Uncharacterized protein n=1 Tax=Liparis tanakae TaxID=230148 RepID=A0A4Z2IJI0_9TELE|nr:hypothetical protein EYF80_011675 [Liparis tanakae]
MELLNEPHSSHSSSLFVGAALLETTDYGCSLRSTEQVGSMMRQNLPGADCLSACRVPACEKVLKFNPQRQTLVELYEVLSHKGHLDVLGFHSSRAKASWHYGGFRPETRCVCINSLLIIT